MCLLCAPIRIVTGGTAAFVPVLSMKSRLQRSATLVTFSLTLRFSKPTTVYSLFQGVIYVEPPPWSEKRLVLLRYDLITFLYAASASIGRRCRTSTRKLAAPFCAVWNHARSYSHPWQAGRHGIAEAAELAIAPATIVLEPGDIVWCTLAAVRHLLYDYDDCCVAMRRIRCW